MSQQPFVPQQYPPQYQQPVPQQGYAPQPGYQPQPQGYAQPGFPQQGYGQPPAQQPPAQPLAEGSLDAFYSQPSVGGGKSLSWTTPDGQQKPIGTTYVGVIERDVTRSDVQQETDQKTQQPKFFRDGNPKFVMKVPLKQVALLINGQPQTDPGYADGEATWWVKGRARDELVRAMSEAGCEGAPKGGATVVITLVQRKSMGAGMNPANVVQVRYLPGAGQAQAAQPAPVQPATEAPSPVAVAPQQVPQAPVQQYQPQAPQVDPYAQGGQIVQQPAQQPFPAAQQVQPQQAPQYAQPQVPQAPVAQTPAGQIAMPENLSPGQQQLFAQLAGTPQVQG